jgi:hypothetical protein
VPRLYLSYLHGQCKALFKVTLDEYEHKPSRKKQSLLAKDENFTFSRRHKIDFVLAQNEGSAMDHQMFRRRRPKRSCHSSHTEKHAAYCQ